MNRTQRKRLQRLYAEIPPVDCIPGCTDCCGMVPWAMGELERVMAHPAAAGLRIIHTSGERGPGAVLGTADGQPCLDCPFSLNGTCDVHSDRPLVCRLFAATSDDRMRCPHGRHATKLLRPEQERRIMEEYSALCSEMAPANPHDTIDLMELVRSARASNSKN